MGGRSRIKIALVMATLICCNSAWSAKRRQCSYKELKEKSCLLTSWDYTIKLTKDKIILNNKVWRSIEDLPFSGERTSWETVFVTQLGHRKFLSLKIWDTPVGEADIQALYWVLYELDAGKVFLKVKRELQKRRWSGSGPSKLKDRRWRTLLKRGKGHRIIWAVGKEKGEF